MTELTNSCIYLDTQSVTEYISEEWETLVEKIENALKSYSAGKIVQPVRTAVPVKKYGGYFYIRFLIIQALELSSTIYRKNL